MSSSFNSIQLTAPQTTEWTREATAAYSRSMTGRAFDALKSLKEPRWYEVRNMHRKVWRRAICLRGRI
jgi:hypothetical protein